MTWLLPRLLVTLLGTLGGGLIGWWVQRADSVFIGAMFGFAVAAAFILVRDTLRGYRLIDWLRGSQEGEAPRTAGLWGELAYRVERSLRLRERQSHVERNRLSQFLAAIEVSPNGVMLLDAGDQIEWCNSVAADHFALDPQRDRRQPVTNLVRSPAFVAYMQARQFGEAVEVPDPRGGRALSVLVRTYDEGQKLVLSNDITERERSDGMRRDFVANVSHEIRTPLTVLSGFIETLANLPLTEVERKRVLLLMTQQADRMGALVSDLLTLAQLEGSPRPTAERWVALQPLLEQVALDAQVLSTGRHVIVIPSGIATQIAGAHSELLSAIGNLVGNAVRYTPQGGSITVSSEVQGDGSLVVAVADTGPGIAREHLPRLTERFDRVDSSRSRDTGGTGLGLAIVKHVAQRHGGELDIQSELGKGSVFRLMLPAVRVRQAPAEAGAVRAEGAVSSLAEAS